MIPIAVKTCVNIFLLVSFKQKILYVTHTLCLNYSLTRTIEKHHIKSPHTLQK